MENPNLIPFFGVKRQYANLREEILHVTDKVYTSGKVLDGPYTQQFEQLIADRCDRAYAISVNSCTQGLVFALQTLFPAGRVLIPTMSFAATLNSVLLTEHEPTFVDVDYGGIMDLNSVNFSFNDTNIAAVMYVNLFGNIIDYDKLRVMTEFWGQSPRIVEDAAQSFGAKYKGIPSGKLGYVSVLSFDPTKNLPNYGSGGMVLTDDFELAEAVKDLRDNGKSSVHMYPGTNSKMSESDCAQMIVKLQYFDAWQDRRDAIAKYYTQQLSTYVDVLGPGPDVEHAWHKFVIRVQQYRNQLQSHLTANRIETKIHYPHPLDSLGVAHNYAGANLRAGSDQFSRECLSLPIHPELTDSEVEYVVQTVKDFYA